MRKDIFVFFLLFLFVLFFGLIRKLKVDFIPWAHSKSSFPFPLPTATTIPERAPSMHSSTKRVYKINSTRLGASGAINASDLGPDVKFLDNKDFVYDPVGRKDPFSPVIIAPKEPIKKGMRLPAKVITSDRPIFPPAPNRVRKTLETLELSQLSVSAIMWDIQEPKAVLQGPNNKLFMVQRNSRVGRNKGYVTSIREGEVVVVELASDGITAKMKVMTLSK